MDSSRMATKQGGLFSWRFFLGGSLLNFCSLTPFPGGYEMVNRSFVNFMEKKTGRAYDLL